MGSAAHEAGLRSGDKIIAVNGAAISGWDQLKSTIEKNPGRQIDLTVERAGERVEVPATPKRQGGQGFLGVAPDVKIRDVGVAEAVPETFKSMGSIFTGFTHVLGDRLSPSGVSTSASQGFTSAAPKAGSSQDLNRPMSLIGIVDTGSELSGNNIWLLLLLLGQISFILAVFNLLPILPLDGGHVVVVLYEWVASKVRHRRVFVDYRKIIPVSVVLLIPILFLGLSSMVLDIRHLGQSGVGCPRPRPRRAGSTRGIRVGAVPVGGGAPVTVQSMTTTKTADVDGTLAQIYALAAAGATSCAARATRRPRPRGWPRSCPARRCRSIADIHFQYELALAALEAGVARPAAQPGQPPQAGADQAGGRARPRTAACPSASA